MTVRLPNAPAAERILGEDEARRVDAYWRAANYLTVGQIYLMGNPLLRRPLEAADVKPRLLGHWGTTPGLNFVYAHLNALIRRHDANVLFVAGPGHGGPGVVANTYLEGSYTERFPEVTRDEAGLHRLFRQFSFPGGIPSHAGAETPGSINEGGELGYSLVHAYGAVFDNPDLIACCVVGDGEAETGALATSWHSNKFLDPTRDGAVLPILHLNGYKIAGPTVLARIPETELLELFRGYGYEPQVVSGDDPAVMHERMARALEDAHAKIRAIQDDARHAETRPARPCWPMIVLRTPKGWTGPKVVDGVPIEGTWRAHQVPLDKVRENPEHLRMLEAWMRGYRPEELFDAQGALVAELRDLAPAGDRRMGANPHADGSLLRDLALPDLAAYAVPVETPGAETRESTRVLGEYLRDVVRLNAAGGNFRLVGPDETNSNRLDAVFEATDRTSEARILPTDDHLAPDGRVMEVLSEHLCQGWLEGYLLTGRHGLFNCYEAFIHIVDSMVNQHAKWLKVAAAMPWRTTLASLNYLLSSHVWRQDHNGFSHQDPGFLDHLANKKAEVARIYLPPDANTLLAVADRCLRGRGRINAIVAGKQPELQYLDAAAARAHVRAGVGVWAWASSDAGAEPDLVVACAGDVPTLEALAAVDLLGARLPELRIRFVNVVDLMALQTPDEHPHGLDEAAYERLFTRDRPVVFAFHGFPALVHRLTYRRPNHAGMHVHGYREEGTTTTPFDMVVLNRLDRFHLVENALRRLDPATRERLGPRVAALEREVAERLEAHGAYVRERGEDLPEVRDWTWGAYRRAADARPLP